MKAGDIKGADTASQLSLFPNFPGHKKRAETGSMKMGHYSQQQTQMISTEQTKCVSIRIHLRTNNTAPKFCFDQLAKPKV